MSIVVPAVLPASSEEFEEEIALFASIPSVSRVQIDVVDGKFAAPASWPYTAPAELQLRAARKYTLPSLSRIEYEIDLMCFDAERSAQLWIALGATRLTFHVQSTTDLSRLLSAVRRRYGSIISLGVALNVESNLTFIEHAFRELDYVQLMGIARIGRQGEPFDERVFEKVLTLRKRHPELPLQVDGGVSLKNAKKLIALGVSNLIVGSAILRASHPAAAVEEFEALMSPYGV